MRACEKCGKLFADSFSECPNCKSSGFLRKAGKLLAGVFGVLTLLAVIGAIIGPKDEGVASGPSSATADAAPAQLSTKKPAAPAVQSTTAARPPQTEADVPEVQKEAAERQMSVPDYLKARDEASEAYTNCKVELETRAKYDYKSDFFPKYGWGVDGNVIIIKARDVRLQNGFGAFSYVTYYCKWDRQAKKIADLQIDNS